MVSNTINTSDDWRNSIITRRLQLVEQELFNSPRVHLINHGLSVGQCCPILVFCVTFGWPFFVFSSVLCSLYCLSYDLRLLMSRLAFSNFWHLIQEWMDFIKAQEVNIQKWRITHIIGYGFFLCLRTIYLLLSFRIECKYKTVKPAWRTLEGKFKCVNYEQVSSICICYSINGEEKRSSIHTKWTHVPLIIVTQKMSFL